MGVSSVPSSSAEELRASLDAAASQQLGERGAPVAVAVAVAVGGAKRDWCKFGNPNAIGGFGIGLEDED